MLAHEVVIHCRARRQHDVNDVLNGWYQKSNVAIHLSYMQCQERLTWPCKYSVFLKYAPHIPADPFIISGLGLPHYGTGLGLIRGLGFGLLD
jgi:hypothetical protein